MVPANRATTMLLSLFLFVAFFQFPMVRCDHLYASMMFFGYGQTDLFSTVEINMQNGSTTTIATNVLIDGNLYLFEGISSFDVQNHVYYYVLDLITVAEPPDIYSTNVVQGAAGPVFEIEGPVSISCLTANPSNGNQNLLVVYLDGAGDVGIINVVFGTGPVSGVLQLPSMFNLGISFTVAGYIDPVHNMYYLMLPSHKNRTNNYIITIDLNVNKIKSMYPLTCFDIETQFMSYDPTLQMFIGGATSPDLPNTYYIQLDPTTGKCSKTIIKSIGSNDIINCWTYDQNGGNLYYFDTATPGPWFLGSVNVRTGQEDPKVNMDAQLVLSMEYVND